MRVRFDRPTCVAAVLFACAAAACHHGAADRAAGTDPHSSLQTPDSLVGRVQVVGVAASPRVTLVPADGGTVLTLTGPASLRRVDGLGVAIVGRETGSRFQVTRFTVVSANGLPATDGRLLAEGPTLYLETADRVRHALVTPSPRLWEHVGGRAWVSGPLDREPVAYGIIE